MPVKSHVQIPASILEPFATKHIDKYNGSVFCVYKVYRMNINNEIDTISPKEANKLYGYYSDYYENYIEKYEKAFGEAKQKLIKNVGIGNTFSLTACDIRSIKDYIELSMFRNPNFARQISLNMILRQFFQGTDQDLSIDSFNKGKQILDNEYKDYFVTACFNRTQKNFIIPQNSFYFVVGKNKMIMRIVLPISPKIAILFQHKDDTFFKGNAICNLCIDDDDIIDYFNSCAIAQEFGLEKDPSFMYVYAQKEKDLSCYNVADIVAQAKKTCK